MKSTLSLAIEGDASAQEKLICELEPRIRRAIRRRLAPRLRRRVGSDDLLQTTLLELLGRLPSFEERTPEAFEVWVQRITERTVAAAARFHSAALRDRRREVDPPLQHDPIGRATTPSQSFARREAGSRVRSEISRLAEPTRTVLELRSIQGLPFNEIAFRLRLGSAAAARGIHHRGLKELAARLSELDCTSSER